jgi:hypothetical protein
MKVYISGQKRGVTDAIKRDLRRRSAVEPVIGHAKSEHRMGRNFLKGVQGDAANAVLAAAGYNFRRILAWLAAFGAHSSWPSSPTRPTPQSTRSTTPDRSNAPRECDLLHGRRRPGAQGRSCPAVPSTAPFDAPRRAGRARLPRRFFLKLSFSAWTKFQTER